MNDQMLRLSGADLSRLRSLVAAVTSEISHASGAAATSGNQTPKTALDVTWSNLVKLLDLGAEPRMRDCPVCKRPGMFGATRCGYCWTSLPPDKKELAAA
jgi:hypothetical protein